MFSGIVTTKAQVCCLANANQQGVRRLSLELPKEFLARIQTGASVAINGVCLSFLFAKHTIAFFDVILETLKKTNLGGLLAPQKVNVEMSLKLGDEVGGHLLSGHVFQTTSFLGFEQKTQLHYFELSKRIYPYLLTKGFIALNGVSLTLVDIAKDKFAVAIIPHTLATTNLGDLKKNELVNLEIDSQTQTIVDTLTNIMRKSR